MGRISNVYVRCLDKNSQVLEICSINNRVSHFDLKMLRLDEDLMLPGRSVHILGPATEKARDFFQRCSCKMNAKSNCLSPERRLRDGT